MAKSIERAKGLNKAVTSALKGSFDLDSFLRSKNLSSTPMPMKEQRWIPLSPAFQECVSLPGFAIGHINLLRGHSDTGKTTALLEGAVSAQKMGILPVFIITEMKWSWEHLRMMGFDFEEVVDPTTGEVVDYKGFFIYIDREKLNMIEDVSAFIADLLDEQKRGNLPFELCFFWDSVGSIPCRLSIESAKNNNEWNAGAMSQQFGNFINQKIVLSRKISQPYTNTMVVVNKVWVQKPENPMGQPKLRNKGGDTMYFDSSLIFTFGNVTNPGTNKIKAIKNGKEVEFAKRTKLCCDKNHVNDVTSAGKVIMTAHGFIRDDKKDVDAYKKAHSSEWLKVLGSADFDIVEEAEEDSKTVFEASEIE